MFSPNQISELITAIKGRGEIPLKFVYIGETGTNRWDKIAKKRSEDTHGINKVETNLLNAKVNDFLNSFKNLNKLNIIDIGPGNGCQIIPLLKPLEKTGIKFRYVPVDISKEMLELATQNIKKSFPNISVEPVLLDFELGNFAEITYKLRVGGYQNLLLFLGSTLGNQSDRSRVLTNFRDSMTSDDFLIIGVELVNLNKTDKLLKQYIGKDVDDFIFTVAENIGIKREDGEFKVQFNNESNQIEIYFRFLKDKQITLEGEKINFEKDDNLLLGRSHKFTEWIFAKTLSEVGFRIELLTTSSEKGYSLAMCQPQRFNY
jgi:L-histidine Nalpha-methyltransferase